MEVRKNTGQVTTTMDTSHATTATAGCNKDDPAFWLPTHFLTDDDFLAGVVDDCNLKKEQPKTSFDPFSNGGFGFESFEAVDSPVSSDGVDKDRENYDHELLAELTRQLARSTLRQTHNNYAHAPTEKPWMYSTSPQSTLSGQGPWLNRSGFSGNGSPNGPSQVPSPPVSPPGAKDEAAWELLYEAAGQVARLKMNAMAAQLNRHRHHYQQQQQQNRGIVQNSSLCTKSPQMNGIYYVPTPNQHQQLKRQSGGPVHSNPMYCQHNHRHQSGGCGGALGVPQFAWPPARGGAEPHHQNNRRQQTGGSEMRAVFLGGPESVHGGSPAVKRQSTGTGVFLPRRVGTQPEPRKKPSGCSTVLLPARVVQALKLDLDEINNGNNFNNSHSRFGSGFFTDQDAVVARSGLVNQQRRSHDIRLPNDWTY